MEFPNTAGFSENGRIFRKQMDLPKTVDFLKASGVSESVWILRKDFLKTERALLKRVRTLPVWRYRPGELGTLALFKKASGLTT